MDCLISVRKGVGIGPMMSAAGCAPRCDPRNEATHCVDPFGRCAASKLNENAEGVKLGDSADMWFFYVFLKHFDLEICFVPQRRALFRHLNCQKCFG